MVIIIALCIVLVIMASFMGLFFMRYKLRISEEFAVSNKITLNKDNLKCYIINLVRNPERLKRFEVQYETSDLNDIVLEHIEAVDGRKIDIDEHISEQAKLDILSAERMGTRSYHYQLTRGAVGCYLSHMETYLRIANSKEPYALVFEDDVRFMKRKSVLTDLNRELTHVPNDWDILLLGCVCFVCGKYTAHYDVNRFFLLHGYVIKRSSAAKIYELLRNEKIEQQLDAHFSDLCEQGLLKIYCLKNKLAMQWNMGTNIQIPVKQQPGINPFDPISHDENVV